MGRPIVVLATVSLFASGCGDDGPASPTNVSEPQLSSEIPAGTVLSILSGETGAPVPNARIVIDGKSLAANVNGELTLPEPFTRGSLLDILEAGFLDRQTLLRDPASVLFPLWPRNSPTGLDARSTFELVYGELDRTRPMMRILPEASEAFIVPSPAIRNDSVAMETIRESAQLLTDVTRGEIQFSVADRRPPDAVVFELVIDPGDPALVNAVATAKREMRNWVITGGTVVYVTLGTVRTSTTLHELGHLFGLAHSSNSEDVMRPGRSRRIGVEQFSDREVLAMRLMLKRPPGNQKPDNDRNAPVSTLRVPGATWVSVIACP